MLVNVVLRRLLKLGNASRRVYFPRYFHETGSTPAQIPLVKRQDDYLSNAEKVIGYPTSFLNLRWLLNDEIANVAIHMRKLVGTEHPLLHSARDLLLGSNKPTLGLVVLLVSKAGGLKPHVLQIDRDITAGILHSQRVIAEVAEMIDTSHTIHKSVLNSEDTTKDTALGNKLALLTGDYLIATSYRELANIKNHDVNDLFGSILRDLTESEFLGPRDSQNRPLPCRPLTKKLVTKEVPDVFDNKPIDFKEFLGVAKQEWVLRHLWGGASLLGKACQAALMLSEQSKELQEKGYIVGRNFSLALQAKSQKELFQNKTKEFSLVSAPVLFHLQFEPELYEELIENQTNINFGLLQERILKGPALQQTGKLQKEMMSNALAALKEFPESEASVALSNIINAM